MADYYADIRDGRKIYIPSWPVDVSLENLTRAGQYLGPEYLLKISQLDMTAVLLAIMESKDPQQAASLIKHFVCEVRLDGQKIQPNTIDTMFEGDLKVVGELFAHVIKAQYADFFEFGLAKVSSQPS